MPISNTYNSNPSTVDSLLRQRQTRVDLMRESGEILPEPEQAPEPKTLMQKPGQPNPLLVKAGEWGSTENPSDSFFTKVIKDAALLSYAIPVGLTKVGTGLATHPIDTVKELGTGLVQSVKDVFSPDYYKAHPLLGVVNLVGFVAPVAGLAKSAALKGALRTALSTGVREAATLGVEETAARTALSVGMKEVGGALLKKGALGNAVWEAAKTGNIGIVTETVGNLLKTAGVAEETALRVATEVSNNLYTNFSRQTTKMKVLDTLAHPVGAASKYVGEKIDPIRKAIFGDIPKTAVAQIYGAETVAKNPEGFVAIETWADAQLKEQGITSNVANRQRVMQNWVEQNSEWAALTPEQRVEHFRNYAEQDLKRLAIHDATGMDVVTVKALPQNYVDAMVDTIKASGETDMPKLLAMMEDTYGRDFTNHMAEITTAVEKTATKEALIAAISKLGDSRAAISFAKFSPEVQALAKELEQTGYRIGHAPKEKPVTFVTDTMKGAATVPVSDALVKRSMFGNWIDRLGLSPNGIIEGSAEFAYRENFTQGVLGDFVKKYGSIIKAKSITGAGKVAIPVEKLFEWLDKNKAIIRGIREKYTLPVRTVFDLKEADLIRAGFSKEIATDIVSISKKALIEVPASVTGMGDKVVNFLRTRNKGFGAWMSNVYDSYLKAAYRGRYDLSPFFSAQEFVETKLNSALFLKDPSLLAGARTIQKLGAWTAEKLGARLGETATYLRKIIEKPPLAEVAMVKDEILGTLQKTMLDYTSSPDIIGIQNSAAGIQGLAGEAAFEQSIKSRNLWFGLTGQSSVRMATTFNKALAEKFGMTLEKALDYTMEGGVKKYVNPQMVQLMRDSTQQVFHYKPGFLTSPLVKTMNLVWFPLRFEAKTISLVSRWASSLSPASRLVVMNNWVHFANWAGTEDGVQWRRTNRNMFYNIFSYVTAYEQMGQGLEAVAKGRLFGGNAGLIGAVPFGFVANLARQLAIIPGDTDQYDPKTGREFKTTTPRKIVSAASLAVALEQLLISISPSTPFYSLSGGIISGVSPSKIYQSLVRQIVGAGAAAVEGREPARGKQFLERQFKQVPLDYTRFNQ